MRTIKFIKTECGVDFQLNVLSSDFIAENYKERGVHNTDSFEILFFKSAKGTLLLNEQQIEITDHKIVFISPFQKRQWMLQTERPEFTLLIFQEDFLNAFFADKFFTYRLLYFYQLDHPLFLDTTSEDLQNAYEILSEIKSELSFTQPDSGHIIRSLLYYLLQKLNRKYARTYGLSLEKQKDSYAYQFKKLLESHIREKQRIDEYTEILGVSRITLNHSVKALFHVTASHLLKQRLLFEIKDELLHSDKTLAEIAMDLHFSEPNHLMRFFKQQTGQTTSQFLADYQNGTYC